MVQHNICLILFALSYLILQVHCFRARVAPLQPFLATKKDNLIKSKIEVRLKAAPLSKFLGENDNIFRIHSIGASLFGLVLLASPNIFSNGNLGESIAYQQWSFFILAIANLTFFAPTLASESKVLLARTLCVMCLSECAHYTNDLLLKHQYYPPITLAITVVSFFVFGFLAYGYTVSGSMKLKSLLPRLGNQ